MATEGLHHPFADNFWGNEEASIQVIVERSRRSKQTSEQIKRLFEKRAQLEEDYGERLLQIAQSPIGDHEEFGSTFSETLSDIPAATEAAARAHLDLAQQIKHHLDIPLASFVQDQKEIRQATLDRADAAKKQKALQVSNATKAKDIYEMHCQHLMDMRRRLEEHSHQVGQEDIAKLQEQVAQTDQLYKQATQTLATAYNQWYEEWREVCDVFQSLEERRLHYLRSSLWAYANMMSSVHTIDDQSCERIRTSLECMEVGKDLDLFVQKRRTGQVPPEPLKYENHFEKLKHSSKRSDATGGSVLKPLPPIAPPGSLWGSPTSEEGKASGKAESKQIREITIPVVDEELRSVDVQLKRLPTMRNLSGDSMQLANHTAMSPLSTNGMLAVPEPDNGYEVSRRRSKELIESESAEDEKTDLKPPAIDTKNLKDDSLKQTQNGEHPRSDSSNDDGGSVSDFIISRSSNPRPTVNEGSSSIHGSSQKDDVSSPRVQNDTEPTPEAEKRSSTGPTSTKGERRVSNHGAAVARSPTQLSPVTILSDQKTSLMSSPVSMKKPVLPVPLNTHNLNAPVDTSQTNSARTHESPMTEGNSPQHKMSLSQLQQDHFTPRSPQISMPSPMPPITPDSMSPVRNNKESAKSPARTPGVNSSYNEPNYMYPPTEEEDVDLGIRPPPWGFDHLQGNQVEQDSAGFQPALSSSYVDNASSPFLTRAAATMMTFPDKNHEGPRQNNKVEHNRSSPSIEPPSPNGTKSPSLAFKMKTAFAKSSMPEKARTTDAAPKPSRSEVESRSAPRSATDPFVMPAHQVEKLKERSNSRFSLNIFKRDKESKRSRDKPRQMVTNGEQETGHAPSMLSHTISDSESGPPLPPAGHPPQASSPIAINRGGGERGPDSALGLGGGSSTPDLSWSPQKQKPGDVVQIAQRMSSLGMEQLRHRQSGDTPSNPNWPTSSATLADGTPILEYVQALWSYKAQIPDAELSFETNDVLAVITKQQDGWWEAEILHQSRRQRGLVPSNFMKTLKTL
ncbi:hypothetical protein INT43_007041 [Umbelopsis isabellina]|uniref:SH3 domain-containing protein n=1 Tax=Mortierella isabellina TaxID=91625 RepID=A0A8H7PWV5_MORIS|nr:hypothetical protein INT43_007041 [Umbelopsis isabellina]